MLRRTVSVLPSLRTRFETGKLTIRDRVRGLWARLEQAAKSLRENGGTVTADLNDPKLTHIIVDDDDSGRYAELSRRTSQYVHCLHRLAKLISRPKRKHIVLPSWVEECLDEETLMNEDGTFSPLTRLMLRS